jgi:hypothetical protein
MARMNFKPTPGAPPATRAQNEVLQALFAPPRLTDEESARGFHESSWSLREGLDVHEIDELDTVPMVLEGGDFEGSRFGDI